MATEDREHAEELLTIYRRRLWVRERQKARAGDAVDPSVDMDIDQLRLNIAMLEPVVEPQPAEEVKEVVKRHIEDDYLFVFRQVVKVAERLTGVEHAQRSALRWRTTVSNDIAALKEGQQKGKRNAWINHGLLMAILLLVIVFGLLWFRPF